MHQRHGLAQEDCVYAFALRQMLVGSGPRHSYQVLYRNVENSVDVLTLLVAEQDDWPSDLQQIARATPTRVPGAKENRP